MKKESLLLGAAASACLVSSSALAQKTPTTQPVAEDYTNDIIVTAQRKEQSLQRVPIAITAIEPSTISDLNIRSIDNITTVTPGLVLETGYGYLQTYIRGVGAPIANGVGLSTPVALYVDGTYLQRNNGVVLDLYDVAGIEVLKGPQGTLYGRNASGGAVLINTVNPTHTFAASTMLEGGSLSHFLADGMVNAPLSDTLAIRIAGRYRNDPGYVTDTFDGLKLRGKRSESIRGKLKWDPTEDFSALLKLEYHHERGLGGSSGRLDPLGPFCNCSLGLSAAPLKFFENSSDYTPKEKSKGFNAQLIMNYGFGSLSLKSISDYRNINPFIGDDSDHGPSPILTFTSVFGGKTYSQDLQLSSSSDGILDFLAGAAYSHDDAFAYSTLFGSALGIGNPAGSGTPPANAVRSNQFVVSDSYAAFGELYIRPIEKMTVTVGARYSIDKRRSSTQLNPSAIATFNPGGPAAFSQQETGRKFTPRAVIAYDAGRANLYASFTRGYLQGGFTVPTFTPQATPINPETIDNYEIGAKYVSVDRRTHLNIAAFHYIYSDIQVAIIDTTKGGAIKTNAASARGNGVEIDGSRELSKWLKVSAGIAYLDAKFKNFANANVYLLRYNDPLNPTVPTGVSTGPIDASGTRLSRAPKWSGYIQGNATAPLWDDIEGRISVNARYSDDYDIAYDGGGPLRTDVQESMWLVNMSGGIGPSSEAYEIGFYVDNLTNKHYAINKNITAFGLNYQAALPRTYGLRLKLNIE